MVGREGVEPSTLGLRVGKYRAFSLITIQIKYISTVVAAITAVAATNHPIETIEYKLKPYLYGSFGSHDQLRARYRTQSLVCGSVLIHLIILQSKIVFNTDIWRHHGMACERDG